MDELPPQLRQTAVRSGNEYGWRRADVFAALDAARDAGLACLGGEVQFLFPDGTCELYWLSFDPDERRAGESDPEYVARSQEETRTRLLALLASADLVGEGRRSFGFLKEKEDLGAPLEDHLVFICYFVRGESVRPSGTHTERTS